MVCRSARVLTLAYLAYAGRGLMLPILGGFIISGSARRHGLWWLLLRENVGVMLMKCNAVTCGSWLCPQFWWPDMAITHGSSKCGMSSAWPRSMQCGLQRSVCCEVATECKVTRPAHPASPQQCCAPQLSCSSVCCWKSLWRWAGHRERGPGCSLQTPPSFKRGLLAEQHCVCISVGYDMHAHHGRGDRLCGVVCCGALQSLRVLLPCLLP